MGRSKVGVVLSDIHCPFQDKGVLKLAINFIRDNHPDTVHLLGDIVDFYSVSRFLKDPTRKLELQEELDDAADVLGEIREAAFRSKIIFSEGNHEYRLRKYLSSEARALASLRALDLGELLGADRHKMAMRQYDQPYRVGSLLLTHGDYARKWSAYSARAHFERYGCCVLHGHTHRLGSFYHRTVGDTYAAWENGCLCDLNPDYTTVPDWQHGWSVLWSNKDYFHVDQIAVVKGRYMYHGKAYGRRRLSPTAHFEIEDLG